MIIHNNPKHWYIIIIAVIGCLFAGFISCFNYNPFEHYENAKIVIVEQSFQSDDTINIFSTESIAVNLAVSELIDSVTISTTGNRKFSGDRLVIRPDQSTATAEKLYKIYFSFVDTGRKEIEINTYKGNGTTVPLFMYCLVKSPLKQKDLSGEIGKPLSLSTPPVKDDDVVYLWNFGKGILSLSHTNTITANIKKSQIKGTGDLFVTDGKYSSPLVKFNYSFYDTSKPIISIKNTGCIITGDTVRTSLKKFNLFVGVKDPGRTRVDFASINDTLMNRINDTVFTMQFDSLDHKISPLQLHIVAMDNYSSSNVTARTCYLVYDTTVKLSDEYEMKFFIPDILNSVTMQQERSVMGVFSQPLGDTIDVIVKVSDGNGGYKTVRPEKRVFSTSWVSNVTLKDGSNKITATAYNSRTQQKLAYDSCFITYTASGVDSTTPVIFQITIDGQPEGVMSTENDSATVKIIAFDAGTGVDSVTIENAGLKKFICTETDENPYIWMYRVGLSSHGENRFWVHAQDKKGFHTDTPIVIIKNRKPVITSAPESPLRLVAGQKFSDIITAEDPDGDRVTFEISSTKPGPSISSEGLLSWVPDSSYMCKANDFIIHVSDTYGAETLYTLKTQVVSSLQASVSFKRGALDSVLDTMFVLSTYLVGFQVDSSSNMGPYVYNIINKNNGVIKSSDKNVIALRFEMGDTGIVDLLLTVQDKFGTGDTLRKTVTVLFSNTKTGLYLVKDGIDTTDSGEVDLSDSGKCVNLKFIFSDPRWNSATGYTMKVYGESTLLDTTFSGMSVISVPVFSNLKPFGHDTIIAEISNTFGYRETASVLLYYGEKLGEISNVYPADGDTVRESIVKLRWNGEPQGQIVKYELYMGIAPQLDLIASTDTTVLQQHLYKSGKYSWKVRVADSKQELDGSLSTFYYKAADHVKLLTTQAAFANVYYANLDPLMVPLLVDSMTGTKPFAFRAYFADNGKELSVKNDTLSYLPEVADTGLRSIVITVTDSVENSDTAIVLVKIQNHPPIDCQLVYGGTFKDGFIDLSKMIEPVTLGFKISASNYDTLQVSMKNVAVVSLLDTNGILKVQIDPGKAGNPQDELTIRIQRGIYVFQKTYSIIYGNAPEINGTPDPVSGEVYLTPPDTLRWSFIDKDNDSIVYDVYMGNDSMFTLVAKGIENSFYKIDSNLGPGTYYWYVVAYDSRFFTTGPLWNFTVKGQ